MSKSNLVSFPVLQYSTILQLKRAEKSGLHMASVIYPNTEDQNIQVQIQAVMLPFTLGINYVIVIHSF
jgi:aromatic ring-cleaving dioxygenase